MKWTKEKPREEGEYWIRGYQYYEGDTGIPMIVSVDPHNKILCRPWDAYGDKWTSKEFQNVEWYGPLEPPTDT
jgi:hypothetical protein